MSDPAIEAARRAWDAIIERKGGFHGAGRGPNEKPWLTAIEAAREALAPLRKLHQPLRDYDRAFNELESSHCMECSDHGRVDWPCDTARLIYPSEEL